MNLKIIHKNDIKATVKYYRHGIISCISKRGTELL